MEDNHLEINDDESFYDMLKGSGYLDFSYYR